MKITPAGISVEPGVIEPREHPGTGEPMSGAEHPADGTMSPPVGNDDGVPGVQIVQLPEGESAELEPIAAPVAPHAPARPPRRSPPSAPGAQ